MKKCIFLLITVLALFSFSAQAQWPGSTNGQITYTSNTTISTNFALTQNTTVTVNSGVTVRVQGAISGAYSVTKAGTGTLVYEANNTYSGGTTINAGSIVLGWDTPAGSAGSGTITVNTGAEINFCRSNEFTVPNVIAGAGNIYKTGSGKTILTGANTYTGATQINSGILQVGNGTSTTATINSTSGIILMNVSNPVLRFEPGAGVNMTVSKVISGVGNVEIRGPATGASVRFTANNTYTGTTTIEQGYFYIGDNTTTGTVPGNIVNYAYVGFNRSNEYTYSGIISGTGIVGKMGSGKTILTGAHTYTGQTQISGGTLQIGNGTNTTSSINSTSSVLFVNTGNVLRFDIGASMTFSKVISGNGNVEKAGNFNFYLTADNTYTGTTTVEQDYFYLGNNTTTGSVAGNIIVNSGATLLFSRSNAYTYSGVISGAGAVMKSSTGAGTITLNGVNTYTGATTISNGTLTLGTSGTIANSNVVTLGSATAKLDISAGNKTILGLSSTQSAAEVILGARTLTINNSTDRTYAGSITGTGSITKQGTGNLYFTGNNTYTGGTTISAGYLYLGYETTTGSAGTGTITVNTNGNLAFMRSNEFTVPNVIAGAGKVFKLGSGKTILTGANTYTGATQINSGILQIGNGVSTTATINSTSEVILANVAGVVVLRFEPGTDMVFSKVISGAGNVEFKPNTTMTGYKRLTFTGNNTYTGTTTMESGGGQLFIGNNTTTGAIAGNIIVNNGGVVAFERSNEYTYSGVISGNPSVFKGEITTSTTAKTIFTGNNTYTGQTVVTSGILQIGNQTSGSINSTSDVELRSANSVLRFEPGANMTFSRPITGIGKVEYKGELNFRRLYFTGANTYTGTTTIEAGDFYIGNNGTTGSISNSSNVIITSGDLSFNRSNAYTYSGIISGAGRTFHSGTGVLTLTGAHTYTGETVITGGTLILGASASIASSSYVKLSGYSAKLDISAGNKTILGLESMYGAEEVVLGDRTLTVNNSTDRTYNGIITGTGSITKQGAGTLILTGENTYTGATTISAGTLQLGNNTSSGSVAGNIVNNAALIFNRSNNYLYSGIISGSGSVTIQGSYVNFIGNNTYMGGTTISAGSTLCLGNNTTTGSIVGNIVNNGFLFFGRSNTYTYSGVISGPGHVEKYENGTVILIGANTYTGHTRIVAGTLQVGDGTSTVASIGSTSFVNIAADCVFRFEPGVNMTFEKEIAGSGRVEYSGDNTKRLIFTANNTYTGTTTILGWGELFLGNNTTTGSVAGNIINNYRVFFERSNEHTYSGFISGTGQVYKRGQGKTILTGANTYTGETFVQGGTLQIGNGTIGYASINSTAGVDVFAGCVLRFEPAVAAMTFSKVISGEGSVEKSAGTLLLTGNNTYTGTTTIDGGELSLGNNTTTGAISNSSNVITTSAPNSRLVFNRSNGYTYGGVISGPGEVYKMRSGTVTLSGNNTYTGGTRIWQGTLSIGNGGTTGSISNTSGILLDTDGLLIFNRSDALTYSGVISGTGDVAIVGTGVITLSGTNTATGQLTCGAGTLDLAGNWAGSLILGSAANLTVTDNRTIGGTLTFHGGTINMDLSGATPSRLSATGAFTGLGSNTINITGMGTASNYTLISVASGMSTTPFIVTGATGMLSATATQLTFKLDISDLFCGGEGTEQSPYQICDATSLANLAQFVNAGNGDHSEGVYFILTDNIDLSGNANWEPIGTFTDYYDYSKAFQGDFNGNGRIINNLTIDRPLENHIGLFGLTRHAVIYDFGIDNCSVIGQAWVGGLVGECQSTGISKCFVNGVVKSNHASWIGGIAGISQDVSTINNCYFNGSVSGNMGIGGLIGVQSDLSTLSNSYSTGDVSGVQYVGGLVGINISSVIQNCVAANSEITCYNTNIEVNRIAGANNTGMLSNNYALYNMTIIAIGATITRPDDDLNGSSTDMTGLRMEYFYTEPYFWTQGGVWDFVNVWTICDNETFPFFIGQDVTCSDFIVHIAAEGDGGTIVPDYPVGVMAGEDVTFQINLDPGFEVYQIWIYNNDQSQNENYQLEGNILTIFDVQSNLYGYITFKPNWYCTGIGREDMPYEICDAQTLANLAIYVNAGNDLTGKYFILTDNIDLSGYAEGAGWMPIGRYAPNAPFKGNFNGNGFVVKNMTIYRPSTDEIGLFGYINGATIKNLGVENCYVYGNNYVGGLTGDNTASTITNCYVSGSIIATSRIGGITGYNYNATITHCYATVNIFGNNLIGGVVGYNVTNGTVKNCVVANTAISGVNFVNRIVGNNHDATGNMFNNYASEDMAFKMGDNAFNPVDDDKNGTAKSMATLLSRSFYTQSQNWAIATSDPAWDFINLWDICESETMPFFMKQQVSCHNSYTITAISMASASGSGSITYEGVTPVTTGSSLTINFTPDTNSMVSQVWIDGAYIENSENMTSYTFNNINRSHHIVVVFEMIWYRLTATVDNSKGWLSQGGQSYHGTVVWRVPYGYSNPIIFTFGANEGYVVDKLLIDGINVPDSIAGGSYTFTNVTQDRSIEITFKPANIPTIPLSLKVFLEGSMLSAVAMNNTLQAYNFLMPLKRLPLTDPYLGTATYSDANNPNGPAGLVTDWVLVQIWGNLTTQGWQTKYDLLEERALLLKTNGTIVDVDGNVPQFNEQNGAVHIVIKHRSHLSVLTPRITNFKLPVTWDFSTSGAYVDNAWEPEPLKQKFGVKCMYAGALMDVDEEAINMANELAVLTDQRAGKNNGYFQTDLNMDGIVNTADLAMIRANLQLGLYTQGIYFVKR